MVQRSQAHYLEEEEENAPGRHQLRSDWSNVSTSCSMINTACACHEPGANPAWECVNGWSSALQI
ncbi:hypothetical protein DPMN_013550 [Dreissena polymorpha]|uniref:Uncharacterized protein n=1 Tax=Dreissena polymorpha TaxID=45954 RepID=A0A9D4N7V6_DREPO|nr:hypothetical protein DPMN_013550 [Dreissena polymorpha]